MGERTIWPSRLIYILAAIGFAAGLGNLWRFPRLAYEHGGAAFILALVISNIFIIYPLLLFETVVGQRYKAGAPLAMERLRKGTAWIQWIPLLAQFFMLMYYVPVMAWAVRYLFQCFSGGFLAQPSTYFAEEILGLSPGIEEMGGVRPGLILALIAAYGLVVFCLWNGIKSVSKVIKITAIGPFFLLFLLLLRGITLPGAGTGLKAFFLPDWSALLDIRLWQEAIGQSFFSSGLAFGYFAMSASHRTSKAEIPRSAAYILAGNLGVSLLAGLVVFSALGFLAQKQGVPLEDAAQSGPMLVFSVLPAAIAEMPFLRIGSAALLFLVVITLAVDSIFAVVEAMAAGFQDLKREDRGERKTTLIILCVTFLGGIPITFGAGLYYLDILDHFMGGYIFMFVGALEAVLAGWLIGPKKIREWVNQTALETRIGRWFDIVLLLGPVVIGAVFVAAMAAELRGRYGGYPLWALISIGFAPLTLVLALALFLGRLTSKKAAKQDSVDGSFGAES